MTSPTTWIAYSSVLTFLVFAEGPPRWLLPNLTHLETHDMPKLSANILFAMIHGRSEADTLHRSSQPTLPARLERVSLRGEIVSTMKEAGYYSKWVGSLCELSLSWVFSPTVSSRDRKEGQSRGRESGYQSI